MMKQTRKTFLKVLGASTMIAAVNPLNASQLADAKPATNLDLGLASYTLRKFSLDEVIQMVTKLNIKSVALKSMHMPLDATDAQLEAIAQKVKDAGLNLYSAGVIYMKTEDEVNQAFKYAQAAGLPMITGVPVPEVLALAEQRVKETGIKVAMHNHGPEDDVYPSPKSIMDKIENLDSRLGLCIDVGHTLRSGYDPATEIKKYKARLYDVHLKDITSSEPDGSTLEMGRGVLDIPSVLKALKSINYSGVMGTEFEKDADDPMAGLAESIGYARGVMKMI
ncbi:MAG: sugar phosphate isomerase/epimerase family protein [Bacteroidota bacterium]